MEFLTLIRYERIIRDSTVSFTRSSGLSALSMPYRLHVLLLIACFVLSCHFSTWFGETVESEIQDRSSFNFVLRWPTFFAITLMIRTRMVIS